MTAAAKRSLLLLARNETEPTLLTHVRATIRSHRRFLSSPAGPSSSTSSRVVIFSGIQPTERPHIGNYLGALRQWVKLQNEAPPSAVLIYSIVNLHAFTIRRDPQERRKWQRETLATLLAVGLNPKRAIIFYQSHVPDHLTLMWILGCGASIGSLERMTQWKSKTAPSEYDGTADGQWGLFSYPILQAADILLYRATHVPVGHDQSQHLEYARDLAGSFNHKYGEILVRPNTILSPAKRIMSLTEPHRKMSKSHTDPKSRIYITDSPDDISRKIKSALTDSFPGVSYDPVARPGVSNLIDVVSHLEEAQSSEEVAADCQNLSMRAFKDRVMQCIISRLSPIRDEYERLMDADKSQILDDIAREGASTASRHAKATMDIVREATGFEP